MGKKQTVRGSVRHVMTRTAMVLAGFILGVALFTPWGKMWERVLETLDRNTSEYQLSWSGIDRAGPSGFRMKNVELALAGTPGALAFAEADVRVGFNPLAKVRIGTGGPECFLTIHRTGWVDFEGDLNLTYVLRNSDIRGILHAKGKFRTAPKSGAPLKGWADLRTQLLELPGGRSVSDLSYTGVLEGKTVTIRNFSIKTPLDLRVEGKAELNRNNFPATRIQVTGEVMTPTGSEPYNREFTLSDLFRPESQ